MQNKDQCIITVLLILMCMFVTLLSCLGVYDVHFTGSCALSELLSQVSQSHTFS